MKPPLKYKRALFRPFLESFHAWGTGRFPSATKPEPKIHEDRSSLLWDLTLCIPLTGCWFLCFIISFHKMVKCWCVPKYCELLQQINLRRSLERPTCSWSVRSTGNSLELETGVWTGEWGAALWDWAFHLWNLVPSPERQCLNWLAFSNTLKNFATHTQKLN